MVNYRTLLNIKYQQFILISTVVIILIVCLILALCLESYDRYTTYAVYKDNNLQVNVPINEIDNVLKSEYIMSDKQAYSFSINYISDLEIENMVNYQYIYLNNGVKYLDNQVIEITFYYDKQRLIKKIINIIF